MFRRLEELFGWSRIFKLPPLREWSEDHEGLTFLFIVCCVSVYVFGKRHLAEKAKKQGDKTP